MLNPPARFSFGKRMNELISEDRCKLGQTSNQELIYSNKLLASSADASELGKLTCAFNWSTTPVGPMHAWPKSLINMVRTILSSRYPMWLAWGKHLTMFYNDAYAHMTLGPKHPWALGRSFREVWSEIWDEVGPRAESVLTTGISTWDEGLLLFLERNGFPEETYHTFSYSPAFDDLGNIGGILCVVTEDTERNIGERRLRTLRELAARTNEEAKSVGHACQTTALISKKILMMCLLRFYIYLIQMKVRFHWLPLAALRQGTHYAQTLLSLQDLMSHGPLPPYLNPVVVLPSSRNFKSMYYQEALGQSLLHR